MGISKSKSSYTLKEAFFHRMGYQCITVIKIYNGVDRLWVISSYSYNFSVLIRQTNQAISCKGSIDGVSFICTLVHASNRVNERRHLWNEISIINSLYQYPLVV